MHENQPNDKRTAYDAWDKATDGDGSDGSGGIGDCGGGLAGDIFGTLHKWDNVDVYNNVLTPKTHVEC